MDVKTFQERLAQITALAKKQGNEISPHQIQDLMGEDQLEKDQMEKVLTYLRTLGISCGDEELEVETESQEEILEADPLSAQEEQYLAEYEKNLAGIAKADQEELETLYQSMERGDSQASGRLAEVFLPKVIQASKELHRKNYFLGDMIQEGNMILMTVLQNWKPEGEPEIWIEREIRRGLLQSVQEKEEQSYRDEVLVEKVRKLEAAVRELSEGEEKKFSLEELAILLNMDVDEIRDVLRLTGDDQ